MRWDHLVLGVAATLATATPVWAKCGPNEPTPTPNSRYVIKDGEAFDTKTNLTWQRCSVGQQWQDGKGCIGRVVAMPWTEAMKLAGNGWRVPTQAELVTLSTPTCMPLSKPNLGSAAVNEEVFPDMELGKLGYWTSDEHGPLYAKAVHFGDHEDLYQQNGTRPLSVRLVRSGK